MRIEIKGIALDPDGFNIIRALFVGLKEGGSSVCASAIVEHLKDIGATYAIVEYPYTDLDYSTDYWSFYATAFHEYPRFTKRVHFFKADVSAIVGKPLAEQSAEFKKTEYLGFLVVRPIGQGPIGRTNLPYPASTDSYVVRAGARAGISAQLRGHTFSIPDVAPFIQQDTRVGACAQAAIWMAARPIHLRYPRATWHSVTEITQHATTPTDVALSQSLPAGSAGLNPLHIIRALRGMGHQPLYYLFRDQERLESARLKSGPALEAAKIAAPSPEAAETILRYIDGGLGVVLALDDIEHAITAVGYIEDRGGAVREGSSYDCFVRALIVHDDQRGPYRYMPLTEKDIEHLPKDRLLNDHGKILTVDQAVSHMFVALPNRVLISADRANLVVRDYLEKLATNNDPELIARIQEKKAHILPFINAFLDLFAAGELVQRTYLTTAGKYRRHIAETNLSDDVKAGLIDRALPHFVWVTELILRKNSLPEDGQARNVIGHMVLNATSSSNPSSDLLMAHLPHIVVHRNEAEARAHVEDDIIEPAKEFDLECIFFESDGEYRGRCRYPR